VQVLLCPDSFKGTLSATEACAAMARGLARVGADANTLLLPLADGGEGTARVLSGAFGGRTSSALVTGPLGGQIRAQYTLFEDREGRSCAALDFAAAAGLPLVPCEIRNPLHATSYGVGLLVRAVLRHRTSRIFLGLGGSATCDGGAGMAAALGVVFHGMNEGPISAEQLYGVTSIDTTNRVPSLDSTELIALHDVMNPLTGPQGAATVFGPQKGATPEQVESLEAGLLHLARLTRTDPSRPGSGAAGGAGFGAVAFCGADLQPGLPTVLSVLDFDGHLAGADLVITGEGQFDMQSQAGKVVGGVLQRAEAARVPVVVLAGQIAPSAPDLPLPEATELYSLETESGSLNVAQREPARIIEELTERVVKKRIDST